MILLITSHCFLPRNAPEIGIVLLLLRIRNGSGLPKFLYSNGSTGVLAVTVYLVVVQSINRVRRTRVGVTHNTRLAAWLYTRNAQGYVGFLLFEYM